MDNNFEFRTYRKTTFTGLFLNYFANAPLYYKKSLVYCLINRIFNVTSNWNIFHSDVGILFKVLAKNGYPFSFLHNVLFKFLNKKMSHTVNTVSKFDFSNVVFVPYFGKVSETFKHSIRKFCRVKNIPVNVIFKSIKLGSCFSLKDKTPVLIRSGIVYEFKCPVDQDITYIGKTTRHLITRVKEHRKINSPLCEHFLSCSCINNNVNNHFKVLSAGCGNLDVKIRESLLILTRRPTLNIQINQGSEFSVKLFN